MPHMDLDHAQLERLAILAEELGEAQRAVGKILRHGYNSMWPKTNGFSNREILEKELGDVVFAIKFLSQHLDINDVHVVNHSKDKYKTIGQWLYFNSIEEKP